MIEYYSKIRNNTKYYSKKINVTDKINYGDCFKNGCILEEF